MRTIILLGFLFINSILFSQSFNEAIESKKLGATREFTITLPKYYEQDTQKKYPILLILDGEYLSSPFEGVLKYGNYWDDLQK